jgi:uncharacterized protein
MSEKIHDIQIKKTLIIGASTNPERYSYKAINMLRLYNHPVIAYSLKKGLVSDVNFVAEFPVKGEEIDTVSMYIGEKNQEEFYQPIVDLSPNRVIFNPGTENHEFYILLKKNNIYYEEACTLVKLSIGDY